MGVDQANIHGFGLVKREDDMIAPTVFRYSHIRSSEEHLATCRVDQYAGCLRARRVEGDGQWDPVASLRCPPVNGKYVVLVSPLNSSVAPHNFRSVLYLIHLCLDQWSVNKWKDAHCYSGDIPRKAMLLHLKSNDFSTESKTNHFYNRLSSNIFATWICRVSSNCISSECLRTWH